MASKAPKWPRKVDAQVAELDRIRKLDALTPEDAAVVSKGLATKVGLVVAGAAKLVVRHGLSQAAADLHAAFERLLEDPAKRDPQCRGKLAVVEALAELEADSEAIYRRGLTWVQLEPVWGGTVDTAAPLRGACAHALVNLRVWDLMARLTDLLADPERPARIAAIHALVASGRPEAIYVLRLQARLRDPELEITSACFEGVLALDEAEGVDFVVEHLKDPDPAIVDNALIALGHSRREDALPPLIQWLREVPAPGQAGVGFAAVVAHRSEAGMIFLLERLAQGALPEALQVLDALSPLAFDPRTVERVLQATADRTEPKLRAKVQAQFPR